MTIASLVGLPPRPVIRNTDRLIVSDRNCGVEIEIENINPRAIIEKTRGAWDATEDHSLRPRNMSIEIRTSKGGLCGKALTDSFDMLPALKLHPTEGNHFSWRTGLHCHVDVRDRVPDDIRVLATKYALIEPFIFQWCGNGRHESRFSMPWWVVSRDVTRISEMLMDSNRPSSSAFVNAIQHFSKYTALNLAPMVRLGTVEFRHGQSTVQIPTILNYVNICLALVESSVSNGDRDQCSNLIQYYIMHGPAAFMKEHIHPQIADLLAVQPTNKRPLTEEIVQLAVGVAVDIAGLGQKASSMIAPENYLDSLELVIMNRDNSARRSLDRAVGIVFDAELEVTANGPPAPRPGQQRTATAAAGVASRLRDIRRRNTPTGGEIT